MQGEPHRHTHTLANPSGLHLRPISAFVEEALKFQSDVMVSRDGSPPVNGKSSINMLTLAAEQGTALIVEVSGPDAQQALSALVKVLERISSGEFEVE
jgi:phosphotransferase system HPr (HPr) family protein